MENCLHGCRVNGKQGKLGVILLGIKQCGLDVTKVRNEKDVMYG